MKSKSLFKLDLEFKYGLKYDFLKKNQKYENFFWIFKKSIYLCPAFGTRA